MIMLEDTFCMEQDTIIALTGWGSLLPIKQTVLDKRKQRPNTSLTNQRLFDILLMSLIHGD
ncbi:hypothetical protein DB351_00675 [Klebsiella pneumoniae]|nr:hypothetical protein DB351_13750 [Klebsiella pneumoniae]PUG97568.1 hypothetical protein DB351_00675 [Klebsiella pneumoniae]HBX4001175.1 hypothetical protein [Klebsiella variicola]